MVNNFKTLVESPNIKDLMRRAKEQKARAALLGNDDADKVPPVQFGKTKGNKLELTAPNGARIIAVLKHKGRWVIDTKHSAHRIVERGQISIKQMETFFKRMIEKYLSMGPKYTSIRHRNFLFFSESLNQGMVVSYESSDNAPGGKNAFVIVTFFPRGSKRAKPGTEIILIESCNDVHGNPYFSEAFMEYADFLRCHFSRGTPECFLNGDYVPECINVDGEVFDMVFCENKLFTLSDYEVIEID